ncbi:MAG: hypothetical protein OXJ53_09620, partial [Gammaproteobacteria bacterium]|nr:hypothetical protein [Gammaproteobacteria bacterium]
KQNLHEPSPGLRRRELHRRCSHAVMHRVEPARRRLERRLRALLGHGVRPGGNPKQNLHEPSPGLRRRELHRQCSHAVMHQVGLSRLEVLRRTFRTAKHWLLCPNSTRRT